MREGEWQPWSLVWSVGVWRGGRGGILRNGRVGGALLMPSQCLGAWKGSWRRRVEGREPLQITVLKPLWFHIDVKVF